MNDMTPTREQREAKLEGMGCKRKRVEDIRFTQGKGNYVDDLKLPGMLHGDFVRSPHAHARVKSINSEEALKVPGVLAVITAETLKTVNLAWMPTLAGDVQMVLADGKVLFQNQEVAFVVATDRYAADDGINKVVVEYEPLPVVIDPFKAMDADSDRSMTAVQQIIVTAFGTNLRPANVFQLHNAIGRVFQNNVFELLRLR